ncbi:MAG: leucine-rich repeat protein, partial [Clostridia bacterium]|nr:leucine-rich repeat protein [Clostridia bacterium]
VIKADPNNFYYDVKGNCLITKDSNTLVFANALSVIPADGSVKALGNRCMVAQKSLKSINIPMGVTTIGTEAFAGCSSLESVRLPSSIKTLGLCMFFGCNNLKEVVFDGTKAEWDAINKGEMGANFTVYVKGLFGAKKAIRIKSGITI